jgi:hypothetical protein
MINVREVRFTPVNGHHPAALACRFCARNRHARSYSITSSAIMSSVADTSKWGLG